MTRPDALRTILRAQSYLRYLSLEDAGTGHESRLADELGEALKAFAEPGGALTDDQRRALWDAVTEYAQSCGADTGMAIACGRRVSAVARVERVAEALRDNTPPSPADTPTRVIPAAEMIRVEPVGRCEVCGWPLAGTGSHPLACVPGNCSYRPEHGSAEWHRIQQRKREFAKRTGQRIIDDLAARTFTPLLWSDRPSEAETVPPHYQIDQGPNGWSAYYFADARDNVPDISPEGCFPNREAAKAWCQRHADGEALEPRRCERCKMPVEVDRSRCAVRVVPRGDSRRDAGDVQRRVAERAGGEGCDF